MGKRVSEAAHDYVLHKGKGENKHALTRPRSRDRDSTHTMNVGSRPEGTGGRGKDAKAE